MRPDLGERWSVGDSEGHGDLPESRDLGPLSQYAAKAGCLVTQTPALVDALLATRLTTSTGAGSDLNWLEVPEWIGQICD